MHVVATAGHVDHGKSALVRRLTGMEPDRWDEERRRGMTIDLGFAWTTLPSGEEVAFVDVPGHERFVGNMLAGVGPVPAVLLVVAADEGWMPQTEEHVAALDALGVRHGLLVVTKTDLSGPDGVADDVRQRLANTTLAGLEVVRVSARTGSGVAALVDALRTVVAALPIPELDSPVRLWVDRAFTISGAGTVVTGTLTAGRLAVGDELEVTGTRVTVRGLQSLQRSVTSVHAVARVAVNLRGVGKGDVPRGTALTSPGAWRHSAEVDALVDDAVPRDVVTHIGSAAVPTRVRALGEGAVRLRFDRALPLRAGDRLLLRHPAARTIVAAVVADVDPAPLRRRGDAVAVAAALRLGERWPGRVVEAPVVAQRNEADVDLTSVRPLVERLAADPFAAPDQDELRGLDRAALAAAARRGLVLDLGRGLYVGATAPEVAAARLRDLPQPFSVSQARQLLGASRRVVLPLLEHLDAARTTRRLDDGTRLLVARPG